MFPVGSAKLPMAHIRCADGQSGSLLRQDPSSMSDLLTNNHQRICNGDVVVLLAEQTWGGMVAARLGCFLALREPPNPTVATGCFLGPARTTKPCKLRYKTASTSQIPRKLQCSAPFGGVLGPFWGEVWGPVGAVLVGLS